MIVLDTNQVRSLDPPAGASFTMLRAIARGRHVLAIPQMVLVETLAHFRLQAAADLAELMRVAQRLRRAGWNEQLPALPEVERLVEARHAELVGAFDQVLATPAGAAEEALQREANRRRPADTSWDPRSKKKGSGARDVVIWLTVVDALERGHGEPVIFLTADGDFGADGALHAELRTELHERVLQKGQLTLCRHVDELLGQLAEQAVVPADLATVLGGQVALDAVARGLERSAVPPLLWQWRIRFATPAASVNGEVRIEELEVSQGGRTVAYQVDAGTWVSAQRTVSGTFYLGLDSGHPLYAQPALAVPFDVEVTLLVAPEGTDAGGRVQVVDCGVPRLHLAP